MNVEVIHNAHFLNRGDKLSLNNLRVTLTDPLKMIYSPISGFIVQLVRAALIWQRMDPLIMIYSPGSGFIVQFS